MKGIKKILIISGLLLSSVVGFSQIASADQMELQPSYDNTIYSELTTLTYFPVAGEEKSCGECTGLMVGIALSENGMRRALLYFDVQNELPADITVTDVELEITVLRSQDPASRLMTLHPVTQPWGEAGSTPILGLGRIGSGGFAVAGDATWTDAIYDNTSNWTLPGGDYDSAVASASIGTFGPFTFSSVELTALVQQWVDGGAVNNGLLLKMDDSVESIALGRFIHSSEGVTPPILRVIYDLPPPDDDEDGIPNSSDNCPTTPNPGQEDNYGTSAGDACEDTDEDTVNDDIDNCPTTPNPGQGDLDNDTVGNACDGLTLITSDTSVTADATSLGDVLIQNNSLLTIELGFTLTINSSLIVESGSGALIKSGGTIIIVA